MIGSAVVTIVCWGGFAFLVARALIKDVLRDARASARPTPPPVAGPPIIRERKVVVPSGRSIHVVTRSQAWDAEAQAYHEHSEQFCAEADQQADRQDELEALEALYASPAWEPRR